MMMLRYGDFTIGVAKTIGRAGFFLRGLHFEYDGIQQLPQIVSEPYQGATARFACGLAVGFVLPFSSWFGGAGGCGGGSSVDGIGMPSIFK
jgi:hypothetical protein